MRRNSSSFVLAVAIALSTIYSCGNGNKSATTGWKYNDTKWGGFEKAKFKEQETGPGLVFIEGGNLIMGQHEQDLLYDRNSFKRSVTIPSFYMDETEVANFHYLEYLYWLMRVHVSNPQVYLAALPDTLVWRNKLSYNEPLVNYYLRHPAYREYPVVGVNWYQAKAYAEWRTDRVNEMILVREGFIKLDINAQDDNNFNTEAYLLGLYTPATIKKQLKDYSPNGNKRDVRLEDGILLPEYRLPTEAEWEYAAYGYMSAEFNENIEYRGIYPWADLTMRMKEPEKARGRMYANYQRKTGDYAGVAGNLNDGGFYTKPVKSKEFVPNDFGLHHMAGNVSEWVMDIYRPLSLTDMNDLAPFRGNVYKTKVTDSDGLIEDKDSLGRIIYREVTEEENINRRNYRKSDNIGYKDELEYIDLEQKYDFGVASLVDNQARVYKGGSWSDRAYWLHPGTRRFLDERQSTATIGFRCVMDRVGDSRKGRR
jgi:sulfatase modifying factor 1